MGILKKVKSWLLDDWCDDCEIRMEVEKKQVFLLPMLVGHYESHDSPIYYYNHLVPIDKVSDIPAGTYAAKIYLYRCPSCDKHIVKITNFLPVRGQEQIEESFAFEDQELYDFVKNS